MFRSYIKIGWRNICKNGFHSFINIFGLSIGLAFSFLIAGYVWNELLVNKNLLNADNQYIIQSRWTNPDQGYELATLGPLAKALKEEYPSLVANYYRYDAITSNVFKGDKVFREGIQVGDSSLLTMYGFSLIQGNPYSALSDPYSLVITENLAFKFFGRKDVLGETLTIESFSGSKHDFSIGAVMENPPDNSVTHLNNTNDNHIFLGPRAADFFQRPIDTWANPNIVSFIELHPNVPVEDLRKPMMDLIKRNANPQIATSLEPYLVPLSKYYLKKDQGLVSKMLFTVCFVALFVLMMAVINFINLSIGKSSGRTREVGVRKVLGGVRKQLILQFIIEAVIMVFFCTIAALIIYVIVSPILGGVLGREIPNLSSFPVFFIAILIIVVIFVGVAAGVYPAYVMANQNVVDSIKGKAASKKGITILRQSLIAIQFLIATVVLIGTIVVTRQVKLFFGSELGYNKEYVVSAQVPRNWTEAGLAKMQTIRNEFSRMPEIRNVSLSWQILNGSDIGRLPIFRLGKDSSEVIATQSLVTDEFYADTYQIPLKSGRFFKDRSDSTTIVINESACFALGWSNAEEAIGKQIVLPGNNLCTVIGVTNNFRFGPMKEEVKPTTILHTELYNVYRFLSFKLASGNIQKSLQALEHKWKTLLPGAAFEYSFMDEALERLYTRELQLQKASRISTVLLIVIVMLGIIGFISLSVQKRTKEIGIRKVLGASFSEISFQFMKEVIPVIFFSGVLSIPIGWYVMQNWLNDYAYRVELNYQPFLISIIVLILMATIIISVQVGRMLATNPVKSLRSE